MKKVILFLIFLCQIGLSIAQSGLYIDNQSVSKGSVTASTQGFETQQFVFNSVFGHMKKMIAKKAAEANKTQGIKDLIIPCCDGLSIEVEKLVQLQAVLSQNNTKNSLDPVTLTKQDAFNLKHLKLKDISSQFAQRSTCLLIRNIAIESGRSMDPPQIINFTNRG